MRTIGILLVIIIAAAAGIYYVVTHLGAIVEAEIERYGTEATGTQVTLDGVEISLKDGSAKLKGLHVANPAGFSDEPAIAVGTIEVALDTDTLTGGEPILIHSVTIGSPAVRYEGAASGSNLQTIQQNLNDYQRSRAGAETAEERKLIIEDLRIREGAITITHTALQGEALSATLPEIRLRNIGKAQGGATYAQVADAVIGAVTRAAIEVAVQKLVTKIGPIGGAATIIEGVGSILNR